MNVEAWRSYVAVLSLLAIGSQVPITAQPRPQEQRNPALPTRVLAAQVSRALVVVLIQDRAGDVISQGSGFFFRPGLIATNLHVLKRASQGYVKSPFDGTSHRISSIVGFDLNHDICVLKIAEPGGRPLALSRDHVLVGDDILGAGNPEGLEASFSKGIVSGIRAGSGLIQIDAAISPGSSGGPVVNLRGEVVGIAVSSLVEGQNLNFAVPVGYLREQKLVWDLPVRVVGGLAVTDLEEDGFHGPVRTFTERQARYTFNKSSNDYVEGPPIPYTTSTFSREGQVEETTFFKDGMENGKQSWEYSDDGLIRRSIDVDSQGHRDTQEYSTGEAVTTQAVRANFDWTVGIGTKGEYWYQEYTYDRRGHLIEKAFPQQGRKIVMKYDLRGREVEALEYKQGKLQSATHSTYEDNELGDWIKQHETFWDANYPDAGFIPWVEHYRDITYYGDTR